MNTEPNDIDIAWVGDRHLRVAVGSDSPQHSPDRVRAAWEQLEIACIPGLQDIVPAYSTLLLSFDLNSLDYDLTETRVRAALQSTPTQPASLPQLIEIPVCYGGVHGPDLEDVARLAGLSAQSVVDLHSSPEYCVHFIGFSPGFPYLSGLPIQLAAARLGRPRTRVPAGSVAIAGDQCGIYPQPTAGGWRLIGRTPVRLFDAQCRPPARLRMGDRVRFVSITPDQWVETESAAKMDHWGTLT